MIMLVTTLYLFPGSVHCWLDGIIPLNSKQSAWFGWIELMRVMTEARWWPSGERGQTLGDWGERKMGIHPSSLWDKRSS